MALLRNGVIARLRRMAWIESARMTERGVLRALVGGFALVVAVLGWAGWVAVRSTRSIENDAAQVGREQLAMARLLNDVQAGQNTMAAILHQLAPGQDGIDRKRLLQELEEADRALRRVAQSAKDTPEAQLWNELSEAAAAFSHGVRGALEQGKDMRPRGLVTLFDKHDRVVRIEQELLTRSEERIERTEQRIENESRQLAKNARYLLGACFLLAMLCAGLTIGFARNSIRRIEEQANELGRVSWNMLQDQETAARRFSHELHDELGQSLAAVKANLTASNAGEWSSRRADCVHLVDEAIANVREMSQLLHPVILDDFGLDAGLRWLTERFSQRSGIGCEYESTFSGRLPEAMETHLFRIAQEALTNVARHSQAGKARVALLLGDGVAILEIEDDGKGFDGAVRESAPSLGLTGMRARAREIGASIRFEVVDGGGARVHVETPIGEKKEEDVQQEDTHTLSR